MFLTPKNDFQLWMVLTCHLVARGHFGDTEIQVVLPFLLLCSHIAKLCRIRMGV